MNKNRLFLMLNVAFLTAFTHPTFCQTIKPFHPMTMQALSPNMGVKNVEKTVQFYYDLLGFELITSVPAKQEGKPLIWALVQSGPVTMMFQEEGNLKEEYPVLAAHPIGASSTIYLTVSGIEQIYQKAKKLSTIVKEPHKTFYGATEFALKDINGYILTVAENAK
jgi:uncharacterized glyoxalase superfamily protein PhnB